MIIITLFNVHARNLGEIKFADLDEAHTLIERHMIKGGTVSIRSVGRKLLTDR